MSSDASAPVVDPHPKPTLDHAEPDAKKQKIDNHGTEMAASTAKYTLFNYFRSSASWRVRIAMQYKGIPYRYHPVNLLKSEQLTDEYVKMNPQRKVPTLVIDGDNKSISQSLAIIDYLEQAHPETPSLFPKDPYLRAKAWSLAEGVNADIQPLHNLSVLNKITAMSSEEAKKEWAVWAVTNGLKALEAGVAEVGGKYCVGDAISIADVCLAPQMSAARRFDIDFSQYPRLVAVERLLNTHPAFIAGHANAQPDKPAGLVVP